MDPFLESVGYLIRVRSLRSLLNSDTAERLLLGGKPIYDIDHRCFPFLNAQRGSTPFLTQVLQLSQADSRLRFLSDSFGMTVRHSLPNHTYGDDACRVYNQTKNQGTRFHASSIDLLVKWYTMTLTCDDV